MEDTAEFLLLSLQHLPHIVARSMDTIVMTWLLMLVCSAHCFNNPYLVAKLVEVLFMMNPSVQVQAENHLYKSSEISYNFSLSQHAHNFTGPTLMVATR